MPLLKFLRNCRTLRFNEPHNSVPSCTGTRKEKSGKFLPPPGWKGHLVTAADAPAAPKKKRA
jgi:hypothetical protein